MGKPEPIDRHRIAQLVALAGLAVVLGLIMLVYDIYQLGQPKPAMGSPPFLCTLICGWLAYMLLAKARKLAKKADGQPDKPDQKTPPSSGG